MKDWITNGKLPPRDPAPMTARMLLQSAIYADERIENKDAHATCSVEAWGVTGRRLWMRCTCLLSAYCTVPDNRENRESLRNMPKEK